MPRKQIEWKRVLLRLGRVPDTTIADELGCTRQAVVAKRRALLIPPFRAPTPGLGSATDTEISRITKVPRSTVGYRRRRQGIPSAYTTRLCRILSDPGLGIESDGVIAGRCGCSRAAVARARALLGMHAAPRLDGEQRAIAGQV
ncbi:MAG: hypothetical protein AAGF11_48615 [Myxococcota bacterium]